jgi:hypothetical protein
LDSLDSSSLYDDVGEKKAIPELILKQNIINAQDSMLLYERQMMSHFRSRGKFYREDIVAFESSLILLFGFLKEMIKDSGLKTENDRLVYKIFIRAERGEVFKPDTLLGLKNFLLRYLHLLNITNLIVSRGKGFEAEIEEDFA